MDTLAGLAALLRSGGDQDRLLEVVARIAARMLGVAAVAVHVYRPAWDDYTAVVGSGPVPEGALTVPLTASDGRPLAILALDEPPAGAPLAMLSVVAEIAASVIEREQLAAAVLLAETLDLRDVATARHSETVGRYAEQIAVELGLPPDHVERLRVAGVLHDIGKLGISDAVLFKPGALDASEWEQIERHPEIGARILEHANLRDVASWVLAHHERIDGAGYPGGLAGDAIPLGGRVLAVADAYEAMTSNRPYRAALPEDVARSELRRAAGTQFDPAGRRGVPTRAGVAAAARRRRAPLRGRRRARAPRRRPPP